MQQELDEIYGDPSDPGSFGGVERLLTSAKAKGKVINRNQVKEYLKSNKSYSLHKPVRRRFGRNPTIVGGIDRQWQADLVDMSDLSKNNNGFRYLLTVIDCFSKFAWAVPVKTKDSLSVITAFKDIIGRRSPQKLQTDKGKEFLNKDFQNFMKKNKIHHFVTENETKASMAERFNRTLKSRMWTYFTHNNTRKFLDVLPKLVNSYNHSKHRTIGMAPFQVKKEHESELFKRMYGKTLGLSLVGKLKNKKDSNVRISKVKHIFEKGYLPNWTGEVFKVKKAIPRNGKSIYKLEDLAGEDVAGTFYPEEIQEIDYDKDEVAPIEKILKTRTVKGKNEHLVKWMHYPAKFNSWIPDRDLQRIDGD